MTLKQFQIWFEGKFSTLIEYKVTSFSQLSTNEDIKEILSQLSSYAKGGKHFRPYMVYVGYMTEGGEYDIFSLLAAIELLHLFCLVQDDIIDNESFRHGTETLHRRVAEIKQSREIGRSVAMLVGDLLLAWSVECLEQTEIVEPYTIDDAKKEFRTLLSEVLHGQLLDVLLITNDNPSQEIILRSMYLKSAQYSFSRPLYIGTVLAGADQESKDFVEEYGINLGMAYQLQDDRNDCLSDIKEGQQTLLSWYMFNQAADEDRKEFDLFFSKEWSEDEEQKLMNVLRHSGALSYVEKSIEDYFLQAEDAIFNHNKGGEEVWQEIITTVKNV